VAAVVDAAGRSPVLTLGCALLLIAGTWWYGSHLELRSDLLELLPRDSPGFLAFEHQAGRGAAGASLLVLVESPDRAQNQKLIDAVADQIEALQQRQTRCNASCGDEACRKACGPELIKGIERGTKEVNTWFGHNKWLYAGLEDLRDAEARVRARVAAATGLYVDLDEEDGPAAAPSSTGGGAAPPKDRGGLRELRARVDRALARLDEFPGGYFSLPDGTAIGLRIIGRSTGTGDSLGDRLLQETKRIVEQLQPQGFHPAMQVGFAGDISNATEEKDSLVADALWATLGALFLILAGVVLFYRTAWALAIIGIPAFLGVGCAYSFAMARYGYVNTAGLFLGAIILGNGINYPIVLLSRYQEFRARGLPPEVARREAVWNAFRAELVGALVAAIAYGSLTVTRFRGFNQFGAIGFFGMLMVWATMIPVVPAILSLVERLQPSLPTWLRDRPARFGPDGDRGPLVRANAWLVEHHPRKILVVAALLALGLGAKLPRYLADPWEYDFDKLGSSGSKQTGSAKWSTKADDVFGGKNNISGALMLADAPEQTELVKQQILANDRKDPQGPLVAEIVTVRSLLPGSDDEQREKLAILVRLREQLQRLLPRLDGAERADVEALVPPADLQVQEPKDLPRLLRARFEEKNGTVGTVFYVKYGNQVVLANGHNLLRIAKTTDNVRLPDGTLVQTASRSTIFAEMLRSLERDGPLASGASLFAVVVVVLAATRNVRGALAVLVSLLLGVTWAVGLAAWLDHRLNFLNFIALPITFGIGCEYPFNVYDRSRLLGGNVLSALLRVGGAVALCSYTTTIGYSSMLVADLQALQSFGWLAVSGEIGCLVAALLVLPALLRVWPPRPGEVDATSSPAASG
jgi:predicted exporter